MSIAILIATFFSLGFFIESIVGFGGAIIAYSLLSFFIDIKQMIIAGLYIGTCSSAYIVYTDFKSFNQQVFLKSFPICIIGTVTGVYIFSASNSNILALILGLLLMTLSFKIMFFDKKNLPLFLKNKLLIIGGISQGAFGIGGPFFVNALRQDFQNKSELRTTIATFFVCFNIIRITQLSLQGHIKWDFFLDIWWAMIPIALAINLGFKAHLKTNESLFKKMIALVTLFGGLKFLIQFLYH